MRFEDISRTDIENLIEEWIHNERNRKILKRRLIDGILFDDLSAEFNLSVQQIKTIVYRGTDTIFRHLKEK
jgi:hypothetical protein